MSLSQTLKKLQALKSRQSNALCRLILSLAPINSGAIGFAGLKKKEKKLVIKYHLYNKGLENSIVN